MAGGADIFLKAPVEDGHIHQGEDDESDTGAGQDGESSQDAELAADKNQEDNYGQHHLDGTAFSTRAAAIHTEGSFRRWFGRGWRRAPCSCGLPAKVAELGVVGNLFTAFTTEHLASSLLIKNDLDAVRIIFFDVAGQKL